MDFSSLSAFKPGLANVASYAWVLWVLVPIAVLVFGAFMWKNIRAKNKQWTHKLRMKRVMQNDSLSKEVVIRMRRFPLIKRAEVFELETSVLGGYLMPELASYTGTNEFSIIIDTNNRIYVSEGEKFVKDKSCVNVSAKHAEIDIARSDLRSDFQNVNKTSKRAEWSTIAKYAMVGLLIIGVMVVSIKGIGQWGENHKIDAQKAAAEAEAFSNLANVMLTNEGIVNTQIILIDMIKEMKETNNIQNIVRSAKNETT
jgi:preprotein translocase subunit Sss1